MSQRRQIYAYHPLVYLFCIIIRSDPWLHDAVAKQSKKRSGISNNIYEHGVPFYMTLFLFKMSHNIYNMFSRATITEYQPLGDTKAPARSASGARGFVSPRADLLVC